MDPEKHHIFPVHHHQSSKTYSISIPSFLLPHAMPCHATQFTNVFPQSPHTTVSTVPCLPVLSCLAWLGNNCQKVCPHPEAYKPCPKQCKMCAAKNGMKKARGKGGKGGRVGGKRCGGGGGREGCLCARGEPNLPTQQAWEGASQSISRIQGNMGWEGGMCRVGRHRGLGWGRGTCLPPPPASRPALFLSFACSTVFPFSISKVPKTCLVLPAMSCPPSVPACFQPHCLSRGPEVPN